MARGWLSYLVCCVLMVCGWGAGGSAAGQCLDWDPRYTYNQFQRDDARLALQFDDGAGLDWYIFGGSMDAQSPSGYGVIRLHDTGGSHEWQNINPPGATQFSGITSAVVHDDGTGPGIFACGIGSRVLRFRDGAWTDLSQAGLYYWDIVLFDDGSGPRVHALAWNGVTIALHRWTGSSWIDVTTPAPPVRSPAATRFNFAYDAARDELVRFGGESGGLLLNNTTWVWSRASGWQERAVPGPSSRVGAVMVWNPVRQRVMLYGGVANGVTFDDFWEWDGTAWSQVAGLTPSARSYATAAFDSARGRLVLMAGLDSAGVPLNEVWEWDGTTWLNAGNATFSPRYNATSTFDPVNNRIVFYGGQTAPSTGANGTYSWNGVAWTLMGGEIGTRFDNSMVFDYQTSQIKVAAVPLLPEGNMRVMYRNGNFWSNSNFNTPAGVHPGQLASTPVGGLFVSGANGGLWERAGSVWSDLVPPVPPLDQSNSRMMAVRHAGGSRLYISGLVRNFALAGLGVFNGESLTFINTPDTGEVRELFALPDGEHETLLIRSSTGSVYTYSPEAGYAPFPGQPASRFAMVDRGNGPELWAARADGGAAQISRIYRRVGETWEFVAEFPFPGEGCCNFMTQGTFEGRWCVMTGPNIGILVEDCDPVTITRQPDAIPAGLHTSFEFNVDATGTSPITYQWRRNGIPLVDGGKVSGATTDRLFIQYPGLSDTGVYDVAVTNPVGTVYSDPASASLVEISPPSGPVEWEIALATPFALDGPDDFDTCTRLSPPLIAANGRIVLAGALRSPTIPGYYQYFVIENDQPSLVPPFQLPWFGLPTSSVAPVMPLSGGGELVEASNQAGGFAYFTANGSSVSRGWETGAASPVPGLFFSPSNRRFLREHHDGSYLAMLPLTASPPNGPSGRYLFRYDPPSTFTLLMPPSVVIGSETVYQSDFADSSPDGDFLVADVGNGLVTNYSGSWEWIARHNEPIPGLPGELYQYPRSPYFDPSGNCYFPGTLDGVTMRVRAGAQPEVLWNRWEHWDNLPTGHTAKLSVVAANSSGDVLVSGSVRDAAQVTVRWGYFLVREGRLLDIMTSATGLPSYLSPLTTATGFARDGIATLSESGEVLVFTRLLGFAPSWFLMGWTEEAGLIPVVIPGSHVQVPGVGTKMILDVIPPSWNGQIEFLLNDSHQFAVAARCNDSNDVVLRGSFLDLLTEWRSCPVLFQNFTSRRVNGGDDVALSLDASGAAPLTFEWRRENIPLTDGPTPDGSVVSGTSTATLHIENVSLADAGSYQLHATNSCGAAESRTITLGVQCTADFDLSGGVDSDDVIRFFFWWDVGGSIADINRDGGVDSDDVIFFFAHWDAGC